ncbi:MAG TPA: serine/threonine-protein kinase [Polyangiaceae bacterium]|nr:serine/threonine-protein kinase [Polyangiaceae bacterium]
MLLDNPTVVAIGTILDGKFRVTKEIGRGGMAAVYEAENVDIGKRVAVKVLSAELANSKVVTERFMREARAAAKIRSPYICDVYDVGTYGGRPFLVMELLEGESLYDRLARERRLEPKDVLQIASETAMGLQQAHDANIVHRDLKPENIFLARGGANDRVSKIVDFGLAKFYDPHLEGGANARLTKEGALFGTPAYMSPEQASARGPIGLRSDLWALGCIVYEMLVGRTVWNVDQGVAMILAQIASGPLPTPSKVSPGLPKSFDAWFAKALERDEANRFSSATELADALRQALGDGAARAPAPSPTYTAFEAASVDALISGRPEPPLLAPPELKAPVAHSAPPPVAAIPSQMPKFRRSSGRILAFTFAAIALSVVAAVAWVYVEGPPRFLRRVGLDGAPQPVETEPYAQLVAAAQEQLADGEFTDAVASFEHAFENGEKKAARSLRVHARVADEANNSGRCELRGLGHPRAFDASTRSSRPTFARVGQNLIAAWVASAGPKQHAVYTTRLDYALRRIAPEQVITPEVIDARDPQLLGSDGALLLLYTDARGKESLVYGRELSLDGASSSGAHLLNATGSDYAYDPAMARAADGTHWVVYTQADDKRVHDLYLRHLDRSLAPLGAPVRITAYAPPEKLRTVASFASVELSRDLINISYRLQRGVAYQVMQLRISPDDPQLQRGGVERAATQPAKGTEAEGERTDRFVGQAVVLSEETEVQAQPRITCLEAGCLTVWSDDTRGAQAVLLSKDTGEVLWRKNFAAAGSRPAVGRQGQQAAVAWYESDRVKFALVEGSGVAEPSVLGWVKGLQPYPEVVGGAEPGQWYISWRAYEAAIFEPFVARVDCN